jgi:voltage-gated potassium channel
MDPDRRQDLFVRVERATELPMLLLAVVFLIAVAVPEIVDLSTEWAMALEAVVWITWAAFALELIVKTYLAPSRRAYLLEHWMDVVTVLVPFIRPLRLLRVVAAGIRFWTEARTVLRERTFGVIGTATIVAIGAAALLVYLAERGGDGSIQTFADALWWAAATITTVGYGDVYPKTPTGRGIAVLLMFVGISLFGLLTARVAAFFVEADERAEYGKHDQILERLTRIEAALAGRREPGADDGTTEPGRRASHSRSELDR